MRDFNKRPIVMAYYDFENMSSYLNLYPHNNRPRINDVHLWAPEYVKLQKEFSSLEEKFNRISNDF